MSIAIYCSIGTVDRETILEIHSIYTICARPSVCVYYVYVSRCVVLFYCSFVFFVCCASAGAVLRINVQNHNRNELRQNLSIDRIFNIHSVPDKRYMVEIKLMPNEKKTMTIDLFDTHRHTKHTYFQTEKKQKEKLKYRKLFCCMKFAIYLCYIVS